MMQQLRTANGARLADDCARLALLAIPGVMHFIRAEMRRGRGQTLTVPQLRALIYVQYHAGTTLSPLAEHIGLSLPAASRMIDGLVRRDLLQRKVNLQDRRRVHLALTPRGQTVFRHARDGTRAALAQSLRGLSEKDLRTIGRAMELLAEIFCQEPPAAQVSKRSRTA